MMTGVEWIAALLNPRDVAPHPNFMSTEKVTGAGLLALVTQYRIGDVARLTSVQSDDDIAASARLSKGELSLVDAAKRSVIAETQTDGVEALQTLVFDEELPLGARGAACLLATVGLAESDDYDTLIGLLDAFDGTTPSSDDADLRLIRAVTSQQRAFRKLEAGEEDDGGAERALDALHGLRQSEFSSFPTSQGVAWRSDRTVGQIVEQVRATAQAHIANSRPDTFVHDWVRFVRAPAPQLSLRALSAVDSSYWAYVQEVFSDRVGSATRSFFANDPVDPDVSAALLHYELLGDLAQCRAWRSRLGMLRILRVPRDDTWSRAESVRLFRQAQNLEQLDEALRDTRAGGPLDALARDARQIIDHRLSPARLRLGEMAVLSASSPVLTDDEATQALDAVLASISRRVPARERGWQLPSIRLEKAWSAAVALAFPARRLESVASMLLLAAKEAPTDQLLIQGLAGAANDIDWNEVSDVQRLQWRDWLGTSQEAVAVAMREVVGPEIHLVASTNETEVANLESVAVLLNTFFRTQEAPPSQVIRRCTELVPPPATLEGRVHH